jgi:histidyl-tRNA synthetase
MSAGETSIPAVGFGFGDAVIVELLKMKDLLPDTSANKVDVLVYAMPSPPPTAAPGEDPPADSLQAKAIAAASRLREAGMSVELVMEDKKPKWAFQRADKLGAGEQATDSYSFLIIMGVFAYRLRGDVRC